MTKSRAACWSAIPSAILFLLEILLFLLRCICYVLILASFCQSASKFLSRAHHMIENIFGIMATKFRIFRRSIIATPAKVTKITKAACCLHNYLRICEMKNSQSSCFYRPQDTLTGRTVKEYSW